MTFLERDELSYDERLLLWRYALAFESIEAGEGVLDLGCGNGEFAELLGSKGCRVTGVDKDRTRFMELNPSFKFIQTSDPLGLDLGGYDCVVCLEFLEHLDKGIAKELMWRVPKKFILSTPLEDWHGPPTNPYHKFHFRRKELRELLALMDFKILNEVERDGYIFICARRA